VPANFLGTLEGSNITVRASSIHAHGIIETSNLGPAGGEGLGTPPATINNLCLGHISAPGAGHGGIGGANRYAYSTIDDANDNPLTPGGEAYGLASDPWDMGSGGGRAAFYDPVTEASGGSGGRGGGFIRLIAEDGDLSIGSAGQVNANG